MKEINRSEYDLIYIISKQEGDDDSENFDRILEYSEDSQSNSKDARR
jgi:hypothetical protein